MSDPLFKREVLDGLSAHQKTLPCKYLYDQRGSELFEEITTLEEYYPTRTELALLEAAGPVIAEAIGKKANIVEYGAGALLKTRLLLSALEDISLYQPVDISETFLQLAADDLQQDFPDLEIHPVVGNFLQQDLDVNPHPAPEAGRDVGFFPGSTLGNLSDEEIVNFLLGTLTHLKARPCLLIGIDTNQDPETLRPAYDDASGVTAAFNKNLLTRINRELRANFDEDLFAHEARWNEDASRVEMHLVSQTRHKVTIDGQAIHFDKGETIHTENSRKFTTAQLSLLANKAGWQISQQWRAPQDNFSLILLEV